MDLTIKEEKLLADVKEALDSAFEFMNPCAIRSPFGDAGGLNSPEIAGKRIQRLRIDHEEDQSPALVLGRQIREGKPVQTFRKEANSEGQMKLSKMKRLDIIIETAQRDKVIDIIKESGATGYTVYEVLDGEGMRESREDIGFVHPSKNVGIFLIGPEDVVMELFQKISKLFPNYAGIVFSSDVEVSRRGRFSKPVITRLVKRFKGVVS